nr:sigma factor [Streptomyces litmocidini]
MEAGTAALAPTRAHARHVASDTDHDAFVRDVYERYGPLLVRYAARLLDGDRHRAEHVLQETAARAWKRAPLSSARSEHVRPWLFTVVRNLVIDHHRARQVRPLDLTAVEDLNASWEATESTITSPAVLEALRELKEQHPDRHPSRVLPGVRRGPGGRAPRHPARHRQEPRLLRRAGPAQGIGEAGRARPVVTARTGGAGVLPALPRIGPLAFGELRQQREKTSERDRRGCGTSGSATGGPPVRQRASDLVRPCSPPGTSSSASPVRPSGR